MLPLRNFVLCSLAQITGETFSGLVPFAKNLRARARLLACSPARLRGRASARVNARELSVYTREPRIPECAQMLYE